MASRYTQAREIRVPAGSRLYSGKDLQTALLQIDQNLPSAVSLETSVGASTTLDAAVTSNAVLTMTGNTVVTLANIPAAGLMRQIVCVMKQGGAGAFIPSFPDVDIWDNGQPPVYDPTVGSETIVVLHMQEGGFIRGMHGQYIKRAPFCTAPGVDMGVKTTSNMIWFYRTARLVGFKVLTTVGPSGVDLITDFNKHVGAVASGTTVFTNQANRPKVVAGQQQSSTVVNMDVTAIAAGDALSCNIDQVGTTAKGQGMTAWALWVEV